jgi:ATP-dependent DNA helicase RecG
LKPIPLKYIKGVGPHREEILKKELGISFFHELLYHFPFRYIDRSRIYTLEELYVRSENESSGEVQVWLTVQNAETAGEKRKKRLLVTATDGKRKAYLVWFQGINWISGKIKIGKRYLVFGKPSWFDQTLQFAHPEIREEEKLQGKEIPPYVPVYFTSEAMKRAGLDSDMLFQIISGGIRQYPDLTLSENLPEAVLRKYDLLSRREALRLIHLPSNKAEIERARRRMKFEELFYLQLPLGKILKERKKFSKGIVLNEPGEFFKKFYENHLPFALTDDQKKVIREMYEEMKSGRQMNRLLQGDVGSGKTIVAVILMLMIIGNGHQVCMMVPTEILAQQHFRNLQDYFHPLGIRMALLTGSVKKSEKEILYGEIQAGNIQVVIGTHALIEENVKFRQLGLAIVDEQHRFGVAQRAKLTQHYAPPPHILIMSATPIPRTMALTLYGDLDVSVIRQMPEGRKPVKTLHFYENARLRIIGLMRDQIAKGRQVYVVYPLIQESEKMDYHNLEMGYEGICRDFPYPPYRVSMVHGKMSQDERDEVMQLFAAGKIDILVATTVIEVGVNVPNATVMIIESAERFGLSQLHQLRGRVGRGSEESYCILLTGNKLSTEARKRTEAMLMTTDGFKISEIDLELRGPGELAGTRQSGTEKLNIANLITDGDILQQCREAVLDLLDRDPQLVMPENQCVVEYRNEKKKSDYDWSKVG